MAEGLDAVGSDLGVDVAVAVHEDGVEDVLDGALQGLALGAALLDPLMKRGHSLLVDLVLLLPLLAFDLSRDLGVALGRLACRLAQGTDHGERDDGGGMSKGPDGGRGHGRDPDLDVLDEGGFDVEGTGGVEGSDERVEEGDEGRAEDVVVACSGDQRVVGDVLLRGGHQSWLVVRVTSRTHRLVLVL